MEGHLPDEGCTQRGPRDGAPAMFPSRFVVPSPPRALAAGGFSRGRQVQRAANCWHLGRASPGENALTRRGARKCQLQASSLPVLFPRAPSKAAPPPSPGSHGTARVTPPPRPGRPRRGLGGAEVEPPPHPTPCPAPPPTRSLGQRRLLSSGPSGASMLTPAPSATQTPAAPRWSERLQAQRGPSPPDVGRR